MSQRELTLLSRSYCHLCEDMRQALETAPGREKFSIRVVDVDEHPALEERYGILVPVLLDGEVEICHYHLDSAKLAAHLAVIE
jgi:glutaredoxin